MASRLKEVGLKKAPITDRLSTFGYVRWKEEVKKVGLEPIYGVEIGVTHSMGDKVPSVDWWSFYGQKDIKTINELIYLATSQPNAMLSYKQLEKKLKGVVAIAGETTRLDLTPKHIPMFLSPSIPRGNFKKALEEGRTFVASSANVFAREEDRELYRVVMGRSAFTQTYPQWIMSDDEYAKVMAWAGDKVVKAALKERDRLMASCSPELKVAKILRPEKPKTLRAMCEEGAKRKGVNLKDKVYSARLTRELDMIAKKEFEDYFYVIADMVSWAKEKMVVGPARGSSCGSLVCYLLDITAIDPIPYNLLFERFIDITRADLPDIDLDFSDERRELVFKYAEEKYGRAHVARLGSVNFFKAKSILNQVAPALKIPDWMINDLSNTVIKRAFGDSRADSTIEDTFAATEIGQRMMREFPEVSIITKMEWHPHVSTQHAAGVVITQDPVTDIVAVDNRTGATMCDKKDAEKLGLLKIDALGLTQLGVFERCLDLMGESRLSPFLESIPLDDQKAFDLLNEKKFSGVFQFVPGSASAQLVVELVDNLGGRIDELEDLISLTALVRPGPLGSGAATAWLRRRAGQDPVTYFNPQLEPFVKSTLGIIVYQEQVMQIGREIGDLSWDDVTALRKAMSRSLGKEYFDQYGDRWKEGARKRGWGEERIKFWDDLCLFGMWAFNRSHSVAYAVVSYWCLWLKAHYPLEFAAATLDTEGDPLKQVVQLRELREEGVSYVPVDAERSTDRWQVAKVKGKRKGQGSEYLVGPLTAIKGIGPSKVRMILDRRGREEELPPGLKKQLQEAKTEIDSLDPISDAIRRNIPDLTEINIFSSPMPIAKCIPNDVDEQVVMIMGLVQRLAPLNENEPARVARRGGREYPDDDFGLEALNFWVRDDTGADIFCKIDRYKFGTIGKKMLSVCRAGKGLYAVKGTIPKDFRMIKVKQVRYLGNLDGTFNTGEEKPKAKEEEAK